MSHVEELCDGLDQVIERSMEILDENVSYEVMEMTTNSMVQDHIEYDIFPYVFGSECKFISSTARKMRSEIKTFLTGTFNIMSKYGNL
jgi:hypothetical protein